MMMRLLRKELREKRIWLAGMSAAMLIYVSIDSTGSIYAGSPSSDPVSLMLLLLLTAAMGLSGNTSELAFGRVDFIRSRPVSWKSLLAAKVASAILVMLIVAAVGALGTWIFLPQEYLDMVGAGRLSAGAVVAILYMFIGWFLASGFSCVLSGIFGSAIVCALTVSIIIPVGWILNMLAIGLFGSNGVFFDPTEWCMVFCFFAAPVAAVILFRFGLTLSLNARGRRFGLVLAIAAATSFIAGCLFGKSDYRIMDDMTDSLAKVVDQLTVRHNETHENFDHFDHNFWRSVSPDFRYFVTGNASTRVLEKQIIHRIQDGATAEIVRVSREKGSISRLLIGSWMGDESYLYATKSHLELARLLGPGKLLRTPLRIPWPADFHPQRIRVLPNMRLCILEAEKTWIDGPYGRPGMPGPMQPGMPNPMSSSPPRPMPPGKRAWLVEPASGRIVELLWPRPDIGSTPYWNGEYPTHQTPYLAKHCSWVSSTDLEWAQQILSGREDAYRWTPRRVYRDNYPGGGN